MLAPPCFGTLRAPSFWNHGPILQHTTVVSILIDCKFIVFDVLIVFYVIIIGRRAGLFVHGEIMVEGRGGDVFTKEQK